MLTLFLILLLFGASLVVFLWAGTYFFQGYIYTEPTPGLYWQAPAAAASATVFLTLWCVIVASSDKASTTDIPYDTVFRFSPEVAMLDVPAKKLWAIKQDKKVIEYNRKRLDQTRYCYRDTTYDQRPWSSNKVEALELEFEGHKVRFLPREPTVKGAYREYVSDDGWVMRDYDDSSPSGGPTGLPLQFRTGRLLANLFFNLGFFAVLFVSLWLLLRYQMSHALGLSIVIWLVITLVLLPMVLNSAAEVAQKRQPPAGAATAG